MKLKVVAIQVNGFQGRAVHVSWWSKESIEKLKTLEIKTQGRLFLGPRWGDVRASLSSTLTARQAWLVSA